MSPRLGGLALTALFVAGGLGIAPAGALPAQAAAVGQVAVTAVKPRITRNLPSRVIVGVDKRVTLKVKARGKGLTYQWYYSPLSLWWDQYTPGTPEAKTFPRSTVYYHKVSGKAGKRSYLRFKATRAKSGARYIVVIKSGRKTLKTRSTLVLVRTTPAKPFPTSRYATFHATAHWIVQPISGLYWTGHQGQLIKTCMSVGNLTSKTRNPRHELSIMFRDSTGKVWPDQYATNRIVREFIRDSGVGFSQLRPTRPYQHVPTGGPCAGVLLPHSVRARGTWVLTDKSSPSMRLYYRHDES